MNGIDNLINRYDDIGMLMSRLKPAKKICLRCRFVAAQANTCPHCRIAMTVMDYWGRARPPRKGASRAKWDKFYRQFNLKRTLI